MIVTDKETNLKELLYKKSLTAWLQGYTCTVPFADYIMWQSNNESIRFHCISSFGAQTGICGTTEPKYLGF